MPNPWDNDEIVGGNPWDADEVVGTATAPANPWDGDEVVAPAALVPDPKYPTIPGGGDVIAPAPRGNTIEGLVGAASSLAAQPKKTPLVSPQVLEYQKGQDAVIAANKAAEVTKRDSQQQRLRDTFRQQFADKPATIVEGDDIHTPMRSVTGPIGGLTDAQIDSQIEDYRAAGIWSPDWKEQAVQQAGAERTHRAIDTVARQAPGVVKPGFGLGYDDTQVPDWQPPVGSGSAAVAKMPLDDPQRRDIEERAQQLARPAQPFDPSLSEIHLTPPAEAARTLGRGGVHVFDPMTAASMVAGQAMSPDGGAIQTGRQLLEPRQDVLAAMPRSTNLSDFAKYAVNVGEVAPQLLAQAFAAYVTGGSSLAFSATAGASTAASTYMDTWQMVVDNGGTATEANLTAIPAATAAYIITSLSSRAEFDWLKASPTAKASITQFIINRAKGALAEGVQEGVEQIGQETTDALARAINGAPSIPIEQRVANVIDAALTGAGAGGLMPRPRQAHAAAVVARYDRAIEAARADGQAEAAAILDRQRTAVLNKAALDDIAEIRAEQNALKAQAEAKKLAGMQRKAEIIADPLTLPGMGGAIVANLYQSMYDRMAAGELPEPFPAANQSNFARKAKVAFDAGQITSPEDLRLMANPLAAQPAASGGVPPDMVAHRAALLRKAAEYDANRLAGTITDVTPGGYGPSSIASASNPLDHYKRFGVTPEQHIAALEWLSDNNEEFARLEDEQQMLYEAGRSSDADAMQGRLDSIVAAYLNATVGVAAAPAIIAHQEPSRGTESKSESAADEGHSAPRPLVGIEGKRANLVLADGSNPEVRYIAVEAEDLTPSHDARNAFNRNPQGDKNERPYHDPKEGASSRQMVEKVANKPDTNLLLTDTPTPTDGPPMVTPDGVVLGGNARSMGIQLAYHRNGAAAQTIRQATVAAAAKFGIDADRVMSLKNPVIVRVLTHAGARGEMSAILNESLTAAKTSAVDAASRAGRVSADTAAVVASYLQADDAGDVPSIREVLADGRKATRIINLLVKDGAWTNGDVDRFTDAKTGGLNDDGKLSIERTLLGKIIDDPSVLASLSKGVKGKIMSALAPLTRALGDKVNGPRVREVFANAAEAFGGWKASGLSIGDFFFNQQSLMPPPGFADNAVATIALAFDETGPRAFRDAANDMLTKMGIDTGEAASMFGDALPKRSASADDAIISAFGTQVDGASPGGLFGTEAEDDGPMDALSQGGDAFDANIKKADAPPRIKVAPEPGGDAKKLSDIVLDLSKVSGSPIQTNKARKRGVLGTYFAGPARTTIRMTNDIDTSSHEMAHALDDKFDIVGAWIGKRVKSPFDEELSKFWWHGSSKTSGPKSRLRYRRAEGVAEFIRAYLLNPAEARAAAPLFFAHLQSKLPTAVMAQLEAVGRTMRQWAGANAESQVLSNVKTSLDPIGVVQTVKDMFTNEGWDFETTWIDKVKAVTADSMSPAWNAYRWVKQMRGITELLPEKDPQIMIRNFAGLNSKVEDVLDAGMIDARNNRVTPGGIKWLLEPLDATDQKSLEAEMNGVIALSISERVVERAALIDKAVARVAVLTADIRDLTKQHKASQDPDERKFLVEQIREAQREIAITKKKVGYDGVIENMPAWAEAKKSRLAGIGGGITGDVEQARAALQYLAKNPDRMSRLKDGAARLRKWHEALLDYMHDKGRISDEQYAGIKESNKFYVSFQRIFDDVTGAPKRTPASKKLGTMGKVIQKFSGSTRTIENPYVSLMKQTWDMIRESDRNEALRSFTDLFRPKRGMYEGQVENLALVATNSGVGVGEPNSIKIVRNGRDEHWRFNEDIYRAIKGLDDEGFPGWVNILAFPSQLARMAITHSPDFLVRNVQRDTIARYILSGVGSKPWDALAKIDKPTVSEMKRFGADQAGHYMAGRKNYAKEMRRAMREMAGDQKTILVLPARIAGAYGKLARGSELVNRLAEYRKAKVYATKKLGYDEYNANLFAAFQSRDLMDYAVAGTAVRIINRFVPFTNAAIQSLLKAGRAAKGDPWGFVGRMALATMPLSLLSLIWNARDEDDEKEYQQLPDYQRDLFRNFKVGPDTWLRVPKPYELGLMSSAVERSVSAFRGDKHALSGFSGSVAKTLSPFDKGAMAGPGKLFAELMMNYDLFRERAIVPPWENELDLDKRKGIENGSSRLGQILQSVLGADARKIDYYIQNQFGGFGKMATAVSDIGRDGRTADVLRMATGMFTRANLGVDYEFVSQSARKRGKTSSSEMKQLREMRDAVFSSTGEAKRDALRRLQREAAYLRTRVGSGMWQ